MNTKSSVQLFWSDHAWLPQEVIRIDDPGPRPFPRCFCSKRITVSTRGTLPCKEFRHKQRRLSPASRRGWRGGSWSFSKGECMNVCVRSLGQCVETASGAGAGQRSRHRCPGGREEWPRAPDTRQLGTVEGFSSTVSHPFFMCFGTEYAAGPLPVRWFIIYCELLLQRRTSYIRI